MLRRWVLRLIDERLILSIIGLNMVVLFLREFPQLTETQSSVLWLLDYLCTCYFVVELIVKVRIQRWSGYWADGLNRFDFIVVVASLPTLVTAFTSFEDFSLILILRAARLLRIFRVLRFIPHAEQLWAGIGRAVRASVGLIMLMVIFNVVVGLVGCHLFRDLAPQAFGDPLSSVYTIFKVFTLEGWYEVPDAIAASGGAMAGHAARTFFVLVVVVGGMLGMGLTNAVLVDEMLVDNNDDLEAEVAALREQITDLRAEHSAFMTRLSSHLGLPAGHADTGESPPTTE